MCSLSQAIAQISSLSSPPSAAKFPVRHTLELDQPADLACWLAAQPCYPKLLWNSRDRDLQVVALGRYRQFEGAAALKQLEQRVDFNYYWLAGFDLHDSPEPLLFAPLLELRNEAGQLWLQLNSPEALELLDQLKTSLDLNVKSISVERRTDTPDWNQWQQSVGLAQQQFASGCLQKVVLARQSQFDCTTAQPFWPLFKAWQAQTQNCYQIAYQADPDRGFISFTPERLFQRRGDRVTTEALAATQARAPDPQHARQQARQLLNDPKSRHEHALVVVEIEAKLAALGIQLSRSCGTGLLQLPGLHHLHQLIQGRLPRSQMDGELLRTLHPTAAICGLPTEQARRFIREQEPFDRGRYAGSCGFFGPDRAELAVTIRSAQLEDRRLTLFAGAGIVSQSDAWAEWQELESKIELPLRCLNNQGHVDDIDSSSIA